MKLSLRCLFFYHSFRLFSIHWIIFSGSTVVPKLAFGTQPRILFPQDNTQQRSERLWELSVVKWCSVTPTTLNKVWARGDNVPVVELCLEEHVFLDALSLVFVHWPVSFSKAYIYIVLCSVGVNLSRNTKGTFYSTTDILSQRCELIFFQCSILYTVLPFEVVYTQGKSIVDTWIFMD